MLELGPIVATLVVVCAAFGLSYSQLRAVRSGPSSEIGTLIPRLKRTPDAQRLEVATSVTTELTWEGRFVRALASAPDERDRIDMASELVHELDASMSARSSWAAAGLRIAVLGGVLAACWGMIAGS